MKALIIFILVFSFAVVMIGIMQRHKKEHKAMLQRMEYFSGNEEASIGKKNAKELDAKDIKEIIIKKIHAIGAKWHSVHQDVNLDSKMQQADLPITGAEFQVIVAIISTVVGLIAFLMSLVPINFVFGFAGAAFFCLMYINIYISRRQSLFVNQLGSTLLMVSNALRAGFSFMQAMELISNEMEAPIGTEFKKVVNEINLGSTVDVALENMNRRMKSSDFDLVVTAVLIQRQVGGNLSKVLDSISNTINERIRMKNEISALTAQGRLSGLIVGLIPVGIVIMVLTTDPHYFDTMLDDGTGRLFLGAAVGLELLAVFTIKKVVDIDM